MSAQDDYPFGMSMPNRKWQSSSTYRFSFNGKEDDTEWGVQDYGMRIYDKSIAKFLSVDPLTKDYPWNSVYAFAENSPIEFIDLDGGERKHYMVTFNQNTQKPTLTFVKQEDIVTYYPDGEAICSMLGAHQASQRVNEYEEYVLHTTLTETIWKEGVDPRIVKSDVTFTTRNWEEAQNVTEASFPSSTWSWVITQHHQNMRDAGVPVTFGVRMGLKRINSTLMRRASPTVNQPLSTLERVPPLSRAEGGKPRGGSQFIYAPSPKHAKGGWGTYMDLSDDVAQSILNNSVGKGKQRYGVHNGKLYEFQPDNVGGYHGYPIPGNQASPSVLKELLNKGQINKVQYNKMLKGKQ